MAKFQVTVTCVYCGLLLDNDWVPGSEVDKHGKLPEFPLYVGLDHRCGAMITEQVLTVREHLAQQLEEQ